MNVLGVKASEQQMSEELIAANGKEKKMRGKYNK